MHRPSQTGTGQMGSETGVRLLSIKELAEKTGVAKWRWYETIAAGKGPPVVRLGRTLRVSEASLAKWLTAQEQKASGGEA